MSDAREWMDQAERDLEFAEKARRDGYWEWSVYASQQAAEKAAKAVRIALGSSAQEMKKGADAHDPAKLVAELIELAPPDPSVAARLARSNELEKHNQMSRYPDDKRSPSASPGSPLTVLAPHKTYDDQTARDLHEVAVALVDYCRPLLDDVQKFWANR